MTDTQHNLNGVLSTKTESPDLILRSYHSTSLTPEYWWKRKVCHEKYLDRNQVCFYQQNYTIEEKHPSIPSWECAQNHRQPKWFANFIALQITLLKEQKGTDFPNTYSWNEQN